LLRTAVEGSVAGPKKCRPENPICKEYPGWGFPGPTARQSRQVWTNGQQPTNLQCWPRRADGFPAPCPYQQVTILEDTVNGWPGRCENMKKIDDLRPGETCKMRCYKSALCGVWSIENFTARGAPTCWQALHGTNCYKGNVPSPMRAQRVMHGSFRVLMNTMSILIKNLTKAFDTTDVGSNYTEGGERCRRVCLSYLFCQYWQYSAKLGCWVEDPAAKEVAYPMINQSWAMEQFTSDADSVKSGQYIQHNCNHGERIPFPTDAPGLTFPAASSPSLGSRHVEPVKSSGSRSHSSDATGSQTGTHGTQRLVTERMQTQHEHNDAMPLWLKGLIIVGILLCIAAVIGGLYMAIMGHGKGARGVSGGKKGGSSKRSQRTEHSLEPPSMGNMHTYGEPTAWQQGETVPFMQNQGGQGCHGQHQQRGNYGNSFPQPQQGYMPTQPQMYQPMQQQGHQGYM